MRFLIVALAAAMLSACGGSPEDKALAACEASLKEKAQGKVYTLKPGTIKITAVSGTPGEVNVTGEATFDTGLPRETTQLFECTTRVAEGKSDPDVISFSLVWK
jgi:hypothetical protein